MSWPLGSDCTTIIPQLFMLSLIYSNLPQFKLGNVLAAKVSAFFLLSEFLKNQDSIAIGFSVDTAQKAKS